MVLGEKHRWWSLSQNLSELILPQPRLVARNCQAHLDKQPTIQTHTFIFALLLKLTCKLGIQEEAGLIQPTQTRGPARQFRGWRRVLRNHGELSGVEIMEWKTHVHTNGVWVCFSNTHGYNYCIPASLLMERKGGVRPLPVHISIPMVKLEQLF